LTVGFASLGWIEPRKIEQNPLLILDGELSGEMVGVGEINGTMIRVEELTGVLRDDG